MSLYCNKGCFLYAESICVPFNVILNCFLPSQNKSDQLIARGIFYVTQTALYVKPIDKKGISAIVKTRKTF